MDECPECPECSEGATPDPCLFCGTSGGAPGEPHDVEAASEWAPLQDVDAPKPRRWSSVGEVGLA